MSIELKERQVEEVTVVDVTGRITLTFQDNGRDYADPECGSRQLRAKFSDLAARGTRNVLLNLADASYVDSAGIGELLCGFILLANHGGRLKLLNINQRLEHELREQSFYNLFDVRKDEAAAIASFGNDADRSPMAFPHPGQDPC